MVTMVYCGMHSAYILNGGTDPEGLPYLYDIMRWNVNPGQCTALVVAALALTFGSHVFLWTLVIARDAAWRKLGFKTVQQSNHERGSPEETSLFKGERSQPKSEEKLSVGGGCLI